MKTLFCPFCLKKTETIILNEPEKNNDFFWCPYCGELSLYNLRIKGLRRPSEKEIEKIYSNPNNIKLDNINWLPTVTKDEIRFEVIVLDKGKWNPDWSHKYDFYFTERYLKLMYHQTGYLPQVGDIIECEEKPDKCKTNGSTQRFAIVSRIIGQDDYNEIALIVVREKRWFEKQGY